VNVSRETGTPKTPVPGAVVGPLGIEGDAHAGDGHRQVSLLAEEDIASFSARLGRPIRPGEFAENLTLRGVPLGPVAVLDRIRCGAVELEITQIGKACHGEGCAIFRQVGECVMPREGLFARVIRGGPVRPGDPVEVETRPFRIEVITLSDRASRGVYPDRSGPRIREHLERFFAERRWHPAIESRLLPDDAEALSEALVRARKGGVDVVLTTGGTGVGPRDVTPDVVRALGCREIPGIMEAIRLRYGQDNPHALLSRGVAGVLGGTLVYTLPGSVKAVDEYMAEVLRTLEHLVRMLHGIGH
jgi:molybdenum cofactor synthesis domain-containing protein